MATRWAAVCALTILVGCSADPTATGSLVAQSSASNPDKFIQEYLASLEKLKPVTLTAQQKATVEASIRRSMKDPGSARFGGMVAGIGQDGGITVCGVVNGKNSFGGFVGDTTYIGHLKGGAFALMPFWKGGADSHETSVMRCNAHGLTIPS